MYEISVSKGLRIHLSRYLQDGMTCMVNTKALPMLYARPTYHSHSGAWVS